MSPGGLRDEHCAWQLLCELAGHWCDLSLLSLEEPSSVRLGWLVGFVSFEIPARRRVVCAPLLCSAWWSVALLANSSRSMFPN